VRFSPPARQDGGEESDVDFIHEIPIEVAKVACGFRADEVADEAYDVECWELARPGGKRDASAPAAKGGFLKRLFGLR
jgi:hypothetical protein